MAEPTSYDLKKCKFYLVDGATTPNKLEVKFDEGNLTYRRQWTYEYRLNRGDLASGEVREGDHVPMEVSFEGRFNAVISDSGDPITITEFLERENAGSSLVSTGDACEPFAVDLVLEVNHDCGTTKDEIITFPAFRPDSLEGDFGAGQISCSGKCKALKPVAVRTTLA